MKKIDITVVIKKVYTVLFEVLFDSIFLIICHFASFVQKNILCSKAIFLYKFY